MKKIFFVSVLLMLQAGILIAQDISYVRSCIDSLASPRFQGRGYADNGDKIAAGFIAGQLKETGVRPFNEDYYQYYNLDMNTFPGKMELSVGRISLKAGKDFIVSGSSPSVNGTFNTFWINAGTLQTRAGIRKFQKRDLGKTILIIDTGYKDVNVKKFYGAKAILKTENRKLIWDISDGDQVINTAVIDVSREKIPAHHRKGTVNIESVFKKNYQTQNVAGYIPGTVYPDSFYVFIAHYDHLGRMGSEVYFPGAHDNASGCAMLLDLAKYYSKPENKLPFSVAFIFFSGEEAGLLGSKQYIDNPVFPLKAIKFLINLDMVSTGSDGIKVVNGSVLKNEFDLLVKINDNYKYLKTVSPRGEAANSDHYWFYKNGVKCFFIYTLGEEWKEYHTPGDVASGLPLTKYNELFKLITGFIKEMSE